MGTHSEILNMLVCIFLLVVIQALPLESNQRRSTDRWWALAVETFELASNDWGKFSAAVDNKDHTIFSPLFDACDSDADSVISREELFNGNQKISDYFDIPKFYQEYYRKFVNKYWHLMDNDGLILKDFDKHGDVIHQPDGILRNEEFLNI